MGYIIRLRLKQNSTAGTLALLLRASEAARATSTKCIVQIYPGLRLWTSALPSPDPLPTPPPSPPSHFSDLPMPSTLAMLPQDTVSNRLSKASHLVVVQSRMTLNS